MKGSRWFAVTAGGALAGCGPSVYAVRIAQASDELARAEQLDAARKAPYEYHFALEHLRKARAEAAQSSFGDAVQLAQEAREYASRAVQLAQRVEPLEPVAAPESP
jgi:predicted sugar kinase